MIIFKLSALVSLVCSVLNTVCSVAESWPMLLRRAVEFQEWYNTPLPLSVVPDPIGFNPKSISDMQEEARKI